MLPKYRISTHPGEVLLEEFLKPLDISQSKLARRIGYFAAPFTPPYRRGSYTFRKGQASRLLFESHFRREFESQNRHATSIHRNFKRLCTSQFVIPGSL